MYNYISNSSDRENCLTDAAAAHHSHFVKGYVYGDFEVVGICRLGCFIRERIFFEGFKMVNASFLWDAVLIKKF